VAAIILPHRHRAQPGPGALLDLGNPLMNGFTLVAVPGFSHSYLRNDEVPGSDTHTFSGSAVLAGRAHGRALVLNGSTDQMVVCSRPDRVFTNSTDCTMFVVRRHLDTTNRAAAVFGHHRLNSERVLLHAPFSDGNAYWDYGSNASTHRISVAWGTKQTTLEAIVCVAGGGKGRELWRNGIKLAGDVSKVGTSAAGQLSSVVMGAVAGTADLEEVYLAGVVARAWSDAEIAAWSANPWGIFYTPRKLFIPSAAAPPAASARPVVFVCT
jgi:hypothetical protein